ncbi:MAG TPA: DUF3575 domain-containing protein [Hanamia sp.]|nr:DUF3575 domain-containing protein [Hanamia sp.]
MKKVILVATIFLMADAGFAQADIKPNVIKVNPLGALFGSGTVSYERAFHHKNSISIGPSFGIFTYDHFRYTTYGLSAEYRYYFTGFAPRGTYAAVGGNADFGTTKFIDYEGSFNTKTNVSGFRGKLVAGHQWIWKSRFSLDVNAGAQYIRYNFRDKEGFFGDGEALATIFPSIGLAIGYNF